MYYYRLDAAEAEMVHGKTLQTCGPISKTLKTANYSRIPREISNGCLAGSVMHDRESGSSAHNAAAGHDIHDFMPLE